MFHPLGTIILSVGIFISSLIIIFSFSYLYCKLIYGLWNLFELLLEFIITISVCQETELPAKSVSEFSFQRRGGGGEPDLSALQVGCGSHLPD